MNFADKVAEELAKRGRNVLLPIYVQGGGKIGMLELGRLDQICIEDEQYTSEFVDKLLEKLPEHAGLQFVELVLPTKAVSRTEHLISGNVLLRYIETINIRTDGMLRRYDALFRLPNDYVVVENKEQEHA